MEGKRFAAREFCSANSPDIVFDKIPCLLNPFFDGIHEPLLSDRLTPHPA
jgi:hypothetical protein